MSNCKRTISVGVVSLPWIPLTQWSVTEERRAVGKIPFLPRSRVILPWPGLYHLGLPALLPEPSDTAQNEIPSWCWTLSPAVQHKAERCQWWHRPSTPKGQTHPPLSRHNVVQKILINKLSFRALWNNSYPDTLIITKPKKNKKPALLLSSLLSLIDAFH